MNDQTEATETEPGVGQDSEASQRWARDRAYIARLEFLTQMHLLRWDVSGAAVMASSLGEERVRIGTVSVTVLEQLTELLWRHFTSVTTATDPATSDAGCPE